MKHYIFGILLSELSKKIVLLAGPRLKFSEGFPEVQLIQRVCELRQEEYRHPVSIPNGAAWLAELAA